MRNHFFALLFLLGFSAQAFGQSCDGGMVSTTNGDTVVYTCPGDGIDDIYSFNATGTMGTSFTYVITNDMGIILGIPPGNSQNFEGAGTGICLVYGLSYDGTLLAQAGDDINVAMLATGCFDLSDSPVTVNRDVPDAGDVMTTGGDTTVYTCPGDGIDDIYSFAHANNSNSMYAYVITDDQGNILGLPPGNSQNFEGAGTGTCLVWGLAYTGTITAMAGDNVFTTNLSDECFDLSDSPITVNRDVPDAGDVMTTGGETTVYTCPGDGIDDIYSFAHANNSNSMYAYVITDDQGNILGLPPGNSQNFEGAGTGTCLVWGLAYTGTITAMAGDNVFTTNLSDECFDLSDSPITVNRDVPDAGDVMTTGGETTVYTCPGDGIDDIYSFAHANNSNSMYAYVITDDMGNILGLPPGNSQNFEGAGTGTCLVWGLAYTGTITAMAGDNVFTTNLSDECFDLSDSPITVNRDVPDAGDVMTTGGETTVYTCPGDGIDDIYSFAHANNSNSMYAYVITDDMGNILGLPPGNSQNFEGAGTGTCLVWGLAYTGTITAMAGDNVFTTNLSDECFDLSDSPITVNRDVPDAGDVMTTGGETTVYTCPGDGIDDIYSFAHANNSNSMYAYVITDDMGNILGLPPGNSQNFEGAGTGTCLVWGLAYTGTITAMAGDNVFTTNLSDECFDLSDSPITVNRDVPDAGDVMTTGGETTVYTCPGDGIDDIYSFAHANNSNSMYAYVITDDQGNILGLPPGNSQNFEGAGTGTCLVWGLAYTGNITAMAGDNVFSTNLSDECFDLSDSPITVNRDVPDAGDVMTTGGETTVYTCPGDGIDDIYSFAHANNSNSMYAYVITDDQGNILGLPPGNSQNFEGAGTGTCLVWGLAYTGTITAMAGDNVFTTNLSDECFDLSDSPITVNRDVPDAGDVMTTGGETTVYTCPGDGIDDIYSFAHANNSNSMYAYVITDDQGNILGLPPGNSQNFEGAGTGTCLVWGLAYTGTITAMAGDNVFTTNLSDECFDLSDAPITVNRDVPDAGDVSTVDGETVVYTCAGDGLDDIITFAHANNSNSMYAYVITDDQGNILGLPPGNSQNFEGAGVGVCLVWGLAYTGNIIAQAGDNIFNTNLSDECFDISAGHIEVNRRDQCVSGFTLVDAKADVDLFQIFDGDVIDLATINAKKFNVRSDTYGTGIGSMVFDLNGTIGFGTRNRAPFALYGATPSGNYFQGPFGPGTYSITATPYSSKSGKGEKGAPQSITFTVIQTPPFLEVSSFTLVDAQSDQDIGPLVDGDVIDLAITGNKLNVRANVAGVVESVVFDFDGTAPFSTRNLPPYALGGASINGNYWPMVFTPGSYDLTATPYTSKGGNGTAGTALSINFTVMSSTRLGKPMGKGAELMVYPNPAQFETHLSLEEEGEGHQLIRLVNAQGQTVIQEQLYAVGGSWSHDLDVSKLPAGMYLIQVINENRSYQKRLIKE